METKNKQDSNLVAHVRRELQRAKLFDRNEHDQYDGFIGRAVLAMAKAYDDWTKGDSVKQQTVLDVFVAVANGEILSPPTDDPDEWEEFAIEGQTGLKNKRNEFYITRDNRKTWINIRSGGRGVIIDHTTGKPLEGVAVEEELESEVVPAEEGEDGSPVS